MTSYRDRTIAVGHIQTHFLQAGKWPDLVLLHGGEYGTSAKNTWKFNIKPLAEKFHVIALDMLGYRLTDKIYSFSDPAGFRIAHIRQFLQQIAVRRAFSGQVRRGRHDSQSSGYDSAPA